MIVFLLGTGVFLTWRVRGLQFRKLKYALWLAAMRGSIAIGR